MDYRTLGRTGVKVSEICYGTMSFGGDADEAVRLNAAYALGCIGPAAHAAVLAMTTADTLTDTRPVTAWSLGKDPLRENAAAALAKLGPLPQNVITLLQTAHAEGGEYLRLGAKAALDRQEPAP